MISLVSIPILIILPILAAIILVLPIFKNNAIYIRKFASGFSLFYFFYSILFYILYNPIHNQGNCESCTFIPSFRSIFPILNNKLLNQAGISVSFGIDALSISMIILTTFIIGIAIFSARLYINKHHKLFYCLILFLESILVGIFSTTDIFIFFGLWELELIPMYLLISIWGNRNAQKSALKFLLYTFGGSLFMLIGILLIYYTNFAISGSLIADITKLHINNANIILQIFISLLLFIGFAVKIPLIPLHRWLADTHTDAATPVSIILAGILLKLGVYGLMRFNFGILPLAFAYMAPIIALLGLIGIIFGAALAYSQNDIKRIIAYSSISQMGIIVLGLASMSNVGYIGSIFHIVSHAIVAAGLFFAVGIIKNKFGTGNIKRLSGIASVMPRLYGFTMLISISAMGIPFLSGFIGEFLSIYGAIISSIPSIKIIGLLSIGVVICTALYILRFIHNVFFGILPDRFEKVQDIAIHEFIILGIISLVILLLGCFPSLLINFLDISI